MRGGPVLNDVDQSIESTRIYLHLTNAWLAGEYTRAVEALEAHDAEVLP